MEKLKNAVNSAKNFAVSHKTAIAVVATVAVTVVAMRKLQGGCLDEAYKFIEDNGLMNDFLESTNIYPPLDV